MTTVRDYKDAYVGQTCVIIGNGPSLKDIQLEAIQYPTFGTNRIYLSGYVPDFYVCVNDLVLKQFGDEIKEFDAPVKFLSNRYDIGDSSAIILDTTYPSPGFYTPEGSMWEGHTVTYIALQLAHYMGFSKVYLVGVDHDYGDTNSRPNLELVSTEADANHFDADYFGPGTRWHAPDLTMSEFAYTIAKAYFGKCLSSIMNASTRTKLDVFPLADHRVLYGEQREAPKVSAIVSAYKARDYIEGCIDDLMNQSLLPEIIVVAQQDSYEYVTALAKLKRNDYPYYSIISTEDIPTVYKAWNLGIKEAHGKYITNANTDDRHHPQAFAMLSDLLDVRPDIDLVYPNQYITWKNQSFEEFVDEFIAGEFDLVQGRQENAPGLFSWHEYDHTVLTRGCFVGPQPMWRKRLHQRYGYFREEFESAGDYEFWLRIAKEKNMLHVPVVLGLYTARMDGIELQNPILSSEETSMALSLNQSKDHVFFDPMGDFTRISIGPEYVFGVTDQVVDIMGKLKGGE